MENIYNCTRAKNSQSHRAQQLSSNSTDMLTLLVVKCFERLVKRYIVSQIQHLTDPLQFAYQATRGVEDAILTLLHTHLEKPKTHANILFVDFSSAFNTIQVF